MCNFLLSLLPSGTFKLASHDLLSALEVHSNRELKEGEHRLFARRYLNKCIENGRECSVVHFHYHKSDMFGDGVCSFARDRGAEAVIVGRRGISDLRRAVFGSGTLHILNHCSDIPVTVVTENIEDEYPSGRDEERA